MGIHKGDRGPPKDSSQESDERSSPLLLKANSLTKWIVAAAAIFATWTRRWHYSGPFSVVGGIFSVYLTEFLKKIINQDRPDSSPLADPGMPSSHSLVTFFLATTWSILLISSNFLAVVTWIGAATVAWLRVACGYHSWDQIVVGAVLGVGMGVVWATFGKEAQNWFPALVFQVSWGVYAMMAAYFIRQNMSTWLHEGKNL